MKTFLKTVLNTFLFFLFSPYKAFVFPEMIRHSYPNGIACHESPSGGGLLNQYGKNYLPCCFKHMGWRKRRVAKKIN
jgi:hypothetical protein